MPQRPSNIAKICFRPDKCSHTRTSFVRCISWAIWKLVDPDNYVKLPNEIRLQVARNSTDEVWKIEELLLTIKKEVEARETQRTSKNKWKRPQAFYCKTANSHRKRVVCQAKRREKYSPMCLLQGIALFCLLWKGSKSCSTQGNFDERTKMLEVFGSRSYR